MRMKILYTTSLVFLLGCHMYMPRGIGAQSTAEKYLDSIYRPDTVGIKIGMGYITLKDYSIPAKQKAFQQDSDLNKVSKISWADFTRKANDIVSKENGRSTGSIVVLNYSAHRTEHTTAFFIDSSLRKVFDTIEMK
jgi:hypothetical protein